MTPFFMPVGGAITLAHIGHIYAIGIIHQQSTEVWSKSDNVCNTTQSMCELYIKISDGVPGGAVEPLFHARVPASAAS